eukprot:TRINITY_DN61204_c0_g1_i3.p1 TRINITY_DN61204_c0_g1~~TRINITY_DN61204_c0_g1_i3.p1  ORF type:complete len:299 (+),score=34.77 TRINITY_DN61204_c0_g1_i3:112-1008(+)
MFRRFVRALGPDIYRKITFPVKENAEKLVKTGRTTVPFGANYTDDKDAISETLLDAACRNAFHLYLYYTTEDDEFEEAHGQCGFVHLGGVARAVTALHNVVDEEKEGKMWLFHHAAASPLDPTSLNSQRVQWPKGVKQANIRPYVGAANEWRYGVDVQWGTRHYNLDFKNIQRRSFQMVAKGFDFHVGQKVGIAVERCEAPITPENVEANVTQEEIKRIYGGQGTVVYTGEITHVGQQHIEYNLNSFRGCSGAIVFLLDKGQPPTVEQRHHGKAVAVHAGGVPGERMNFGFLLTEPNP